MNLFQALPPVHDGPFHAMFSAAASLLHGSGVWVDEQGREVEVTCVDPSREVLEKSYVWKDRKYLGLVVRRVRKGNVGTCEPPFIHTDHYRLYAEGPG